MKHWQILVNGNFCQQRMANTTLPLFSEKQINSIIIFLSIFSKILEYLGLDFAI